MIAIVGCILAGVVVEGLVLSLYYRRTGRGVSGRALLPNLAAGAMLLLAMGLALAGAAWPWVSLCLFGSLVGHVADLRVRWSN